jgi:hypothetical protein
LKLQAHSDQFPDDTLCQKFSRGFVADVSESERANRLAVNSALLYSNARPIKAIDVACGIIFEPPCGNTPTDDAALHDCFKLLLTANAASNLWD